MTHAPRFSWRRRLHSFGYALAGLSAMLRTQHNAWLHLAATVAVCLTGWHLRVSAADWRWLVLCIALVWAAEALNTAIESVCDQVSPGHSVLVKRAKDVGAGAVLIVALAAATLGTLTLWPYW